ncbi:hypothetical protein ABH909_002824 [Pseudomonas sp. BS3782 TE3695]
MEKALLWQGSFCGEGACSRWVAQQPYAVIAVRLKQSVLWFHDCCAAEREQAPSPQKPPYHKGCLSTQATAPQ